MGSGGGLHTEGGSEYSAKGLGYSSLGVGVGGFLDEGGRDTHCRYVVLEYLVMYGTDTVFLDTAVAGEKDSTGDGRSGHMADEVFCSPR